MAPFSSVTLPGPTSVHISLDMSADQPGQYLAVLKAVYDYEATSEEEVSMKEDQILFLLERTDDE